jgi:hypothetical protein
VGSRLDHGPEHKLHLAFALGRHQCVQQLILGHRIRRFGEEGGLGFGVWGFGFEAACDHQEDKRKRKRM